MNVPKELYYFFQILQLIHYTFCGLWLMSERCWGEVGASDRQPIADALEYIYTFGWHQASMTGQTYYVIAFALIVYAILAFHVAVVMWFQATHRFARWQLFACR